MKSHWCIHDAGTLVEKAQDTMIVNTEVDTLIESNLGTMIINDTDDDDNDDSAAAADNADTMKRSLIFVRSFDDLMLPCASESPVFYIQFVDTGINGIKYELFACLLNKQFLLSLNVPEKAIKQLF